MRKRIASIVLSICLCFTLLPTAAFAEGEGGADPTSTTGTSGYDSEGFCTAYEWVSGKLAKKNGETCSHEGCNGYQPATDDNSDGYYEIGNAGQLYWFAAQVNNNNGQNTINGMLTADITINENVLTNSALNESNSGNFKQWTPIGDDNGSYQGTFDGDGNTISGLYYNCTDTGTDGTSYVGLFGRVYEGGMVKNLTLTDSYINSDGSEEIDIGGIVGYNKGTVENCTVSGTVISGKYNSNGDDEAIVMAGGIVGANTEGTVTGCTSSATVSAKSTGTNDDDSYVEVGGIVGSSRASKVSLCANFGKVSGTGIGKRSKVGGVVGYNFKELMDSDIIATVTNCYNTGTVSGGQNVESCGGVVGSIANAKIENCYNTGTVSDGSTNGGVLGFDYKSGTIITNCYYKADSETDSFDGTTYKTADDFKSGEVAYLLNGSKSDNTVVWKQTLGTDGDSVPTLDSTRGTVYSGYENGSCKVAYGNSALSSTPTHSFDTDGKCIRTDCTAVKYTVTFDPNGGTMDTDTTVTTDTAGKLTALPTATRGGYTFNGWYTAAEGGEQITTETVFAEHTIVYAHWTVVPSGSSSNTTSTTVKNDDGSTTTTVTDKKTGTVTETTKNTDGSTTTIETRKDGTVTETNKTATGTTSTTVTDKDGNSATTVIVSKKDAQSGETVTLPVDEVTAAGSSKDAQEITVEVPSSGATVEIPVKNLTPGTVIVIVDKNGNETVVPTTKQTENGVSVTLSESATIKVIENSKDFSDVKDSDYFGKAVDWASSRGITGGNSATTFGPHDSCTRAQLVTFLWRAAGCPEPNATSSFSDVSAEAYYTKAVAWAFENGIVGGYGNGLFGSDDTITREQMAVILYRFAQHTGMDTTQGGMSVREYKDYDSISDYAVAAIQWAVNAGVMQGYDGNLMPGQPCTRAQIVTMLYRLLGE